MRSALRPVLSPGRLPWNRGCVRRASTFSSELPIVYTAEVQEALHSRKPIVALESTIATHGLDYPESYTLPLELEDIVRRGNAVPATIAVLNGKIHIGLLPEELLRLVSSKTNKPLKVSRRDIAAALVQGKNGGTTVAATMFLAHQAGIKVFCTGGIGGVHRGGERTLDISADLTELGRTPVAVVCAGAKSILDIGRTLEYLETQGVPVATLRSSEFPAFYSRTSGFSSPLELESEAQAASLIYQNDLLQTRSGVLIGVPIPESAKRAAAPIQKAVEQAVEEAEHSGQSSRGKYVTPWLLSRVKELTGGSSVESNIALIKNNAQASTAIATSYTALANKGRNQSANFSPSMPSASSPSNAKHAIGNFDAAPDKSAKVVVVGSAALDITSKAYGSAAETTSPGVVYAEPGGVGRNIAEAASRLMENPALLISSIGTDLFGSTLRASMEKINLPTDGLIASDKVHTPVCNSILDSEGSLLCGVADMLSIEQLKVSQIESIMDKTRPDILAFDGNLNAATITELLRSQSKKAAKLITFFEPTSTAKALRILPYFEQQAASGYEPDRKIHHVSPNRMELEALWMGAKERNLLSFEQINSRNLPNTFTDVIAKHLPAFIQKEGLAQMGIQLLQFFGTIWVKLGSQGLLMIRLSSHPTDFKSKKNIIVHRTPQEQDVILRYYPAIKVSQESIVSVTGAGDSLAGALIACLQTSESSIPIHEEERTCDVMVAVAQEAATLSMACVEAVNPKLSRQLLVKHGVVRV